MMKILNALLIDLGDPILLKYFKYTDCHKITTYLSANFIIEFIKVISNCMHAETMSQLRDHDHVTLSLNKTTDISN